MNSSPHRCKWKFCPPLTQRGDEATLSGEATDTIREREAVDLEKPTAGHNVELTHTAMIGTDEEEIEMDETKEHGENGIDRGKATQQQTVHSRQDTRRTVAQNVEEEFTATTHNIIGENRQQEAEAATVHQNTATTKVTMDEHREDGKC